MKKSMRQRMLAGELYMAADPELAEMHMRAQGWEMVYPITIGDDVWIGGAIISPRVTTGSGTTIGAGSVVTRDIPAGNPCRVIRQLHENER